MKIRKLNLRNKRYHTAPFPARPYLKFYSCQQNKGKCYIVLWDGDVCVFLTDAETGVFACGVINSERFSVTHTVWLIFKPFTELHIFLSTLKSSSDFCHKSRAHFILQFHLMSRFLVFLLLLKKVTHVWCEVSRFGKLGKSPMDVFSYMSLCRWINDNGQDDVNCRGHNNLAVGIWTYKFSCLWPYISIIYYTSNINSLAKELSTLLL